MVMQARIRPWTLAVVVVLAAAACSNPVRDNGHRTMRDVVITAENGDTIARTENNQTWIGAPLVLQRNQPRNVHIFFIAPDGTPFQLPPSGTSHTLHVSSAQPSVARYEAVSATQGRFIGETEGSTTATIHLWHGTHPGGHSDADAPALPITVE